MPDYREPAFRRQFAPLELATFHCKISLLELSFSHKAAWTGEIVGFLMECRIQGCAAARSWALRSGRGERPCDVDEIVRQYTEADPALDAFHATVAAASQSVTALHTSMSPPTYCRSSLGQRSARELARTSKRSRFSVSPRTPASSPIRTLRH